MPFIFLIYMRFMIPDSYNFIMFDPEGKSILYYLLASESLGLGMIWWLMKGATD
jgi:tight adherence protein B